MSLYREAGRGSARTLAVAAAVTLVVGLAIGFGIGRSSAPEPSGADVVKKLRADLRPVAGGLLLIPNEYEQAFRNEGAEAAGVQGAIKRVRSQLAEAAPDLETLDPDGLDALRSGLEQLDAAVKRRAQPSEVEQLVSELKTALRAVPGGR